MRGGALKRVLEIHHHRLPNYRISKEQRRCGHPLSPAPGAALLPSPPCHGAAPLHCCTLFRGKQVGARHLPACATWVSCGYTQARGGRGRGCSEKGQGAPASASPLRQKHSVPCGPVPRASFRRGHRALGDSEWFGVTSLSPPLPPPHSRAWEHGAGTCTECRTFVWWGGLWPGPGGLEWRPVSWSSTTSPFSSQRRRPDTDFMMILSIFFFLMPVLLSPQHNFSFHEINSDYIRFHLLKLKCEIR